MLKPTRTLVFLAVIASLIGIAYFMATSHIKARTSHITIINNGLKTVDVEVTLGDDSFSTGPIAADTTYSDQFVIGREGAMQLKITPAGEEAIVGSHGYFTPNLYGQKVTVLIQPDGTVEFQQGE